MKPSRATQPESQPESDVSLQENVLKLIRQSPKSKREISAVLGQRQVSGQLNKVIRALVASDRIKPTITEKPNSRLQKYQFVQDEGTP